MATFQTYTHAEVKLTPEPSLFRVGDVIDAGAGIDRVVESIREGGMLFYVGGAGSPHYVSSKQAKLLRRPVLVGDHLCGPDGRVWEATGTACNDFIGVRDVNTGIDTSFWIRALKHADGAAIEPIVQPRADFDGSSDVLPSIAYPKINGVRCVMCPAYLADNTPREQLICADCVAKVERDVEAKLAVRSQGIRPPWLAPSRGSKQRLREIIEANIPMAITVEDACRALLGEPPSWTLADRIADALFELNPRVLETVERRSEFRRVTETSRTTSMPYEGRPSTTVQQSVEEDRERFKRGVACAKKDPKHAGDWAEAVEMAGKVAALMGGAR